MEKPLNREKINLEKKINSDMGELQTLTSNQYRAIETHRFAEESIDTAIEREIYRKSMTEERFLEIS